MLLVMQVWPNSTRVCPITNPVSSADMTTIEKNQLVLGVGSHLTQHFVFRHMTSVLSLSWRYRLTEYLSNSYFQDNAYYKVCASCAAVINLIDGAIYLCLIKSRKSVFSFFFFLDRW